MKIGNFEFEVVPLQNELLKISLPKSGGKGLSLLEWCWSKKYVDNSGRLHSVYLLFYTIKGQLHCTNNFVGLCTYEILI